MSQTHQPNISKKVNQDLLKLAKERKEDPTDIPYYLTIEFFQAKQQSWNKL